MISRTVEYALRAIVWIASRPDAPHTTREVAKHTQVPGHYLSKVLQTLAEAGIVSSQRGLGGGFELARDAAKLTVLDVVNAVEPIQRIRVCPLRLASHSERLCALHQRLDDAMATVERAFRDSTIADLVRDGSAERPLCPNSAESAMPVTLGGLAGMGDNKPKPRAKSPRPAPGQSPG